MVSRPLLCAVCRLWDASTAYAAEQAKEERQGGESGGGHAEADEKQCRHEVYEAMLNLSSVLTDAAEFGYSFKIERYRDGRTIVKPAESTIEA